ncbi:MAG: hypothetical protein ACSHYA_15005 [Opitutaceae bacterium]
MNANANPFRSALVEQIRYALPSASLDALTDVAIKQRLSCLLGSHGTGKTTLMEDLEPYFVSRGYQIEQVRLNLDSSKEQRQEAISKHSRHTPHTVCLFDGAEILSRWQWMQVCKVARKQGSLLVATLHKRRGVHVLHETTPDWLRAKGFVQHLAGAHFSSDLLAEAKATFDSNQGNMREVFRRCYLILASE